eukprot:2550394-Prymnesium_polylepis.1
MEGAALVVAQRCMCECGCEFADAITLAKHQGHSPVCAQARLRRLAGIGPSAPAQPEANTTVQSTETAIEFRANRRKTAVVNLRTELRINKLVPGTH